MLYLNNKVNIKVKEMLFNTWKSNKCKIQWKYCSFWLQFFLHRIFKYLKINNSVTRQRYIMLLVLGIKKKNNKKKKEGKAPGSFSFAPSILPLPPFHVFPYPKNQILPSFFPDSACNSLMFYQTCCEYQPFARKDIWQCNSCCSCGGSCSTSQLLVKILWLFTTIYT